MQKVLGCTLLKRQGEKKLQALETAKKRVTKLDRTVTCNLALGVESALAREQQKNGMAASRNGKSEPSENGRTVDVNHLNEGRYD